MKTLRQAIVQGSVLFDLETRDVEEIIHRSLDFLVERGRLSPEHRQPVEQALIRREQEISTAIGHAVAVPHAYLDALEEEIVLFVRLKHGVNLGAPDGIPTRFVFLLIGPADAAAAHLDTLTAIARLMSDEQFRYDAAVAQSEIELQTALDRFVARTAPPVPPPEVAAAEGLAWTGRFAGGLIDDIRRRLPHYVSDFKDGLHTKCLASTLFLVFACLAPAVTFGGVMAAKTGNQIGAVEMLLATAICGVIFALFSGQPLVILGGTGPLLVFTAILYELCNELQVPFLASYAWVGIWTAIFVILAAVTDSSFLMRYFTRFTDEIFAALISVIFIYEAVKALVEVVRDVYGQPTASHDAALVPLILALGTFYIAMSLSRFRRSRYLLPKIREFLADFGPAIALGSMTLLAVWLHSQQPVEWATLEAPERFGPTIEGRHWLLDPFEAPTWVRWAAAGPALLGAVLVFLDQNITARLINNPDHSLKKGPSYHLDLLIVGALIGACSIFGLPWLVAATVRSLNHLRSLATSEEVVRPGGETKERIIHVRETRLTAVAIHVLIGLSLLSLPLLKEIPMAVLYGIFFYMGIVSMAGNQFFERLSLWFMDSKLYPAAHYIRRVPTSTVHKFTLVQLVCLAILWTVKESDLGIVFPLFIALLVPVRLLLDRLIAPEHLAALDTEEEPADEEWV